MIYHIHFFTFARNSLSHRCCIINLISFEYLKLWKNPIYGKNINNNLFYFVWSNNQILMVNQNSNRHNFSNKIVLVTGGTGALGSSITKAFLESNATVISSYLNDREKTGKTQTDGKSTIKLVKTNVTNEEEIEKLVYEILDKYGRIDILVNVVGAFLGGKTVVELRKKNGT